MLVPQDSASVERTAQPRCWCGNLDLAPFSPDYLVCGRCSTLVVASLPEDPTHVRDEVTSLYGLSYFNDHAKEMGHPVLAERARNDLSERCAFWLESLLRYRPPPARTLELGCANGAFVGLLSEAGYQATGLDLSPAVTRFARETFQVPVLTGPLEMQHLEPGSVDVLVMMDVLEHLPDPLETLRTISRLLAPDGLLLAQTPRYDPSRSHADLEKTSDPFLAQLKPAEHLLLLSPSSAEALLAEAGFSVVQLIPAIFGHYDMSFVASRVPLQELPEERWREALRRTRSGRVVEALLDSARRNRGGDPRAPAARAGGGGGRRGGPSGAGTDPPAPARRGGGTLPAPAPD